MNKDKNQIELDLTRRIYELETIQDISLEINSTHNINIIVKVLLKSILGVLGSISGTIFLYDNEKNRITVQASKGLSYKQNSFALSKEVKNWIINTYKPFLPEEIQNDKIRIFFENKIKPAKIWVPLVTKNKLMGIISLGSKLKSIDYTEDDFSFLTTISCQIAQALENAHSYRIIENAKEELKQTNNFLRNILESSSSICFISTDLDHNIIYWNKGAEIIFGYTANEVLHNHKIHILYPENNNEKILENLIENIKLNKKSVNCELVLVTKKKSRLWIKMTLSPHLNQKGQVIGILNIGEDITKRRKAEEELKISLDKLQKTLEGSIQVMVLTVEKRDPYTATHQRRVANIAAAISKEMGFSTEKISCIYLAGVIHDLGKISIPADILSKPGKITEVEFNLIKTHCQVGYEILKQIEFPWPIAEIILQHHERIDGSGYPLALKADDILMEAKVLSVADVVEAISSHRPYRPAFGIDKALEEIAKESNISFDKDVVDACIHLFKNKDFQITEKIKIEILPTF